MRPLTLLCSVFLWEKKRFSLHFVQNTRLYANVKSNISALFLYVLRIRNWFVRQTFIIKNPRVAYIMMNWGDIS